MKNKKSNSTTIFQNGKQSNEKSTNAPMQSPQPMKVFGDDQMNLYWAEKAIANAIPMIIKRNIPGVD